MEKDFAGSVSLSEDVASLAGFGEFVEDFRQQVDFFKGLAALSEETAEESELLAEERKLELFLEAREKLFDEAFEEIDLSKEEDPGEMLVKFALFLYLEDVTEEIGDAVLEKNSRGLIALFDSWRSWLSGFLSWGYFKKEMADVMDDYLKAEPQLVAMCELCGIEARGIQDILEEYADEVADRLPEIPEAPAPEKAKKRKKTK